MSDQTMPYIPHDARAVANYFLDLGANDEIPVNHQKLLKLVYIAHGWHLAITNEPLIFQTVVAWPYGTMIRDIFWEFEWYGDDPIDGRATWGPDGKRYLEPRPYVAQFSSRTKAIVDRVWETHKSIEGQKLSAMTQGPGSPWDDVAGHLESEQIEDLAISNQRIQKYYLRLNSRETTHAATA